MKVAARLLLLVSCALVIAFTMAQCGKSLNTPVGFANADPCPEGKIRIDSLSQNWFYPGTAAVQIQITGCFLGKAADFSKYTAQFGSFKAKPVAVSANTLTVTPPTDIYAATADMAVEVTYAGQTVKLEKAVSAFVPVYSYVTPYAVPIVAGETTVRFAVQGFHQSTQNLHISLKNPITDSTLDLDVIEFQDNYVIARLPEKVNDAVGYFDVDFNGIFVAQSALALYLTASAEERYITKTEPTWLAVGGEQLTRKLTIHGHGLDQAKKIKFTHPFSKETILVDAEESSADKLSFSIDTFSWFDAKAFPKFNQTKYADLSTRMYKGPIWFEVVSETGEFVASSEITIVPTPTAGALSPTATAPMNFAVPNGEVADPATELVLTVPVKDFPHDVPARIRFGDKWTVTLQRSADASETLSGNFGSSPGFVYFPLPQCKDCGDELKADICLLTLDSDLCQSKLGQFHYTKAVEEKKTTIPKIEPNNIFLEDFVNNFDISFYAVEFPETLPERLSLKHEKTGTIIKPVWKVKTASSLTAQVPADCYVPGKCPEGRYLPLIASHTDATKPVDIVVAEHGVINLTFNTAPALLASFPTSFEFKKDSTEATDKVIAALKATYPNLKNVLTGPATKLPYKVEKDNKIGTAVSFTIRPNITQAMLPAKDLFKAITVDLLDETSAIRKAVPEYLEKPGATSSKVSWCALYGKYAADNTCREETVKSKTWIAAVIFTTGLVLGFIGFFIINHTNLCKKQGKNDLLLGDEPIQ